MSPLFREQTPFRIAPIRKFNRPRSTATLILVFFAASATALAQGGSPFDAGFTAMQTLFTGTVAKVASLIAIVIGGYVDPEFPDRSALVFAPEEQHADDGLLQVREIRNLRFNASLVTLSACDTGVGPVGPEGAANIVNAFIEAGAQSVVATLWQLEDHATAQLMTQFYARLSHREKKAEALRQVQIEMLNSGAPPYFWAGFVLDGEPSGTLFQETAN